MSYECNDTRNVEPIVTAPVTKEFYRNGMAKLGAAVSIVTTDGSAGKAGFTASAICSVTDTPPTLLVCLNRAASVYDTVFRNGVVAVNTLAPQHQSLASLFGGRTPVDQRFAAANWFRGESGAPLLEGAVVSFDCRVARLTDVGSHSVLFCEVVGVADGTIASGLLYFDRAYCAIGKCSSELDRGEKHGSERLTEQPAKLVKFIQPAII
jgi:flavin reductase